MIRVDALQRLARGTGQDICLLLRHRSLKAIPERLRRITPERECIVSAERCKRAALDLPQRRHALQCG